MSCWDAQQRLISDTGQLAMKNQTSILIVEDDALIGKFMSRAVEDAGFRSIVAENANTCRMLFFSEMPDLVLLDLGLPDDDGLNLLKEMKEVREDIPVIIVSARERENEKVKALDMGADDYVTKPFGIFELMARIRTALRHRNRSAAASMHEENSVFHHKGLSMDVSKHQVLLNGEEIHLTGKEFRILELLFRHKGKVLTYSWLMQQIWGDFIPADNQILRVNMANIRKKLKENIEEPIYIKTELGVGYRMPEED